MRIAHIIPNSNRAVVETFTRFIFENFDEANHSIYITKQNKEVNQKVRKYKNVHVVDDVTVFDMMKISNKHEKVILHYLKFKTSQLLFMLFVPQLLNKFFWVAWGADLYQWRKKSQGNLLRRLKIKVRNSIAYKFRERIRHFVGIFPPDIEYFKNEFKTNAMTYYASYTGGLYNHLYTKELELIDINEKINRNLCINIQIGHSSAPVLNHIDVLERLSKFRNQNIKIFVPLSYGDNKYGDIVEKKAIELFGDKVVCMRQMVDKDAYMDFLSTIDIAIYNTNRQIGLGNISPMIYLKKKIYIPKDSVMYDYYKSLDINICDYTELNSIEFDEFVKPVDMDKGRKYVIENSLNKEKKIEMWSKVFDHNINEKSNYEK